VIQENTLIGEREVLDRLTSRKDLYAPLEIRSIKPEAGSADRGIDARITLAWRGRIVPFSVEIKARTAPKLISEAIWRLKSYAGSRKENLLLVVPFLSKAIIELLEREKMNGLDLNGNYLIQTADMVAIRLDRKNEFTESQSIKKIFSGSSSLVGRLFLSEKKRFESVNEVCAAIQKLGGSLSLSAVSKVLKGLEDEMIIERGSKGISLLQPEKLLRQLEEGYRPPKILASAKLKISIDAGVPYRFGEPGFFKTFDASKWVLSGETSAFRYTLQADVGISKIYITDLEPYLKDQDERFFNVLAQKTEESFPFFDAQPKGEIRYSSPVQCYLELSKLDKREKEIAEPIREEILKKFK
jgi:hypothetical protein